jgi:hypothetical protein
VIGFLRTALNRLTSIGKPRASDGSSWARARRQSAMPDKTNGCLLVATRSISTHVSATQDAGAQTLNWTPVAAVTLNPERDAVIQAYCDEATDNSVSSTQQTSKLSRGRGYIRSRSARAGVSAIMRCVRLHQLVSAQMSLNHCRPNKAP